MKTVISNTTDQTTGVTTTTFSDGSKTTSQAGTSQTNLNQDGYGTDQYGNPTVTGANRTNQYGDTNQTLAQVQGLNQYRTNNYNRSGQVGTDVNGVDQYNNTGTTASSNTTGASTTIAGRKTWINGNGEIITELSNGNTLVHHVNGNKSLRGPNGQKLRTDSNGNLTNVNADGSTSVSDAYGNNTNAQTSASNTTQVIFRGTLETVSGGQQFSTSQNTNTGTSNTVTQATSTAPAYRTAVDANGRTVYTPVDVTGTPLSVSAASVEPEAPQYGTSKTPVNSTDFARTTTQGSVNDSANTNTTIAPTGTTFNRDTNNGLPVRGVTPALVVKSQTTDGTSGNITTTYTNGLSVVTTKTGSVIGTPLTVANSTTNPNGDKVTTFTSGVVITIRPDNTVAIS